MASPVDSNIKAWIGILRQSSQKHIEFNLTWAFIKNDFYNSLRLSPILRLIVYNHVGTVLTLDDLNTVDCVVERLWIIVWGFENIQTASH